MLGSLLLAACGGGGGGGGAPVPPDAALSTLTVTPNFGTPADGLAQVVITALVRDSANRPLRDRTVVLEVTGAGNTLLQPTETDATGMAEGRLASLVGERKSVVAVIDPGPDEVRLGPVDTEFLRILPGWRFVRNIGSDTADGNTPLTAWRTLGHALTQLIPGDELFVGAGTYDPITITTAATAAEPLVIRGDRAGEFTGDAGEILIDAGGFGAGVVLDGATHVTLRGLSVRGATASGAIRGQSAQDCAILDCRMYESVRGLTLVGTTRTWLEDNRISANTGAGMVLTATADTTILNNLVYGNAGDGLLLVTPSSNLTVEFNTLYRNGGVQVHESVAGSTGTIANNVLAEGTDMGFSLAGGTSIAPLSNLAWLHTGNNPPPAFSADPLFVDPFGPDGILGGIGSADDDFRVSLVSPTLDAGTGAAADRLLRIHGSLGALTTRTDDLEDGSGSDLAVANLGFHYPLGLDPFTSLPARGGRAAFALPGEVNVQSRAWNRDSGAWSATRNSLALNHDMAWVVQRVSPTVQPEEIVAALAVTGTGTQLFVRTWDGRRWSDETPAVMSTAIALSNADERGFDIEYEMQSGDAILARTDGAENVLFQSRTDGAWTVAAPVFAPALHTGTVLWVELVARESTDELALVALDDQQRLASTVWNGAAWTQPILLATQVNELHDFKAFDAAWESQSGDFLVAWGYSQFAEETRFANWVRNTSTWVTGQFVSTDALGMSVSLAADPTSNRIVGIFGEGNSDDDVGVSVWKGSSWSDTAEMTLTGIAQSHAMEVGWLGTSGRAFAMYRDQALTGAFQWATFGTGGWKKQPEVVLPGVGRMVQAEARQIPGTNREMVLLLDENGALFALEHDGNAWVLRNGGVPLATGLDTAAKGRTFDFDLRRL